MTEYTLADFQEEIVQCRSEKATALGKYVDRHNEPMAGLTRLRIERLDAMALYLKRIQDFQAGKKVEEKPAEPEQTLPLEPEAPAPPPDKVEEPEPRPDDFD